MSIEHTVGPIADPDLFRALFETAPDAMIVVDHEGRIVLANPQSERLFGYDAGELDGQPVEVLLPENVRASHGAHRADYMANPRVRPMGAGYELTGRRKDGQAFPVEIGLSPVKSSTGLLYAASIRDISETQRARQALVRARHDTFAAQVGRVALESPSHEIAVEGIPSLVASALEIEGVAILLAGSRGDSLQVRSSIGLADPLPETLPLAFARGALIDSGGESMRGTVARKQMTGERFAALVAAVTQAGFEDVALVPLLDRYEPMGALIALSSGADTFDRDSVHFLQSVANTLAAMVQRSRSEEQLAHSQRLDAIGQLTGGIAHDFNNLLTVISGNLQLLEAELTDQPELREIMDSASRAVDRGAALTRKLLAFGRRQRLMPRPVRPAQLLSDLKEMLKRTLGERVQVSVECDNDVPAVYADPGELDAALINLALNARDAMPRGGVLSISARAGIADGTDPDTALPPGTYVVFTVADTGIGMPPAVLARALDPFFTTKEAGKGSGLGLSMVYGFVKQSGGHLAIDSQLGYGTRIELHLPAAVGDRSEPAPAPAAPLHTGHEHVLVVEDEPGVRGIALAFLRSLGYLVYEAADAESAIEQLARHPEIEVLFSDVVLGSGMTGFDLVREARKLRPGLPALLTSGYERASSDAGDPELADVDLLRKPYRREQLAVALRRALVQPPGG